MAGTIKTTIVTASPLHERSAPRLRLRPQLRAAFGCTHALLLRTRAATPQMRDLLNSSQVSSHCLQGWAVVNSRQYAPDCVSVYHLHRSRQGGRAQRPMDGHRKPKFSPESPVVGQPPAPRPSITSTATRRRCNSSRAGRSSQRRSSARGPAEDLRACELSADEHMDG